MCVYCIYIIYRYIYIYLCAVDCNTLGYPTLHYRYFCVVGEWRSMVVLRGEAEICPFTPMCVGFDENGYGNPSVCSFKIKV
jgi:hypothetical protein